MLTQKFYLRRSANSQTRFCNGYGSSHRHVSTDPTYRICRLVCAVLVFFSFLALGEIWTPNSQLVAIKDTPLLKFPEAGAEVLGTVPMGSVLVAIGEQQANFVRVEIELKQGDKVDGWVEDSALQQDKAPPPEKTAKPSGYYIPKDERQVLKRNPVFYYGLTAGGNYAFIQNAADTNMHTGMGGLVGGVVGFYLTPEIALRMEGNYITYNGTSVDDSLILSFGMAEAAVLGTYQWESFEFFGGLHYNFGLSIADVPSGLASLVTGSADSGGIGGQLGVAYGIPISPWLQLSLRGWYRISFYTSPFFFQGLGASLALEFRA